ncbi:MAG: alanine--glyoxylate aminotransferase family protein [Clostridia bacterium]|nr:alanine--glyoxylate aminotransferase family protein [Clostridia bacterium]
MKDYLMMTPGPTTIRENVRRAMMQPITNPDLDGDFFTLYKEVTEQFKQLVDTKEAAYILCGEGILGLEAACASLIEPGDRVLCLENGIFGKGFGDFVEMYGGQVVYFSGHPQKGIDPEALKIFLEKDHDFKMATLVHCETPSGITNPVHLLAPILKEKGILTVVDAVSAVGGEEMHADAWGIDILLVGSQKCLSAAPGLTLVTVSADAIAAMENRKVPIVGFYANLMIWKEWESKQWFPYTQPISDIYGLKVALENALAEDDMVARHRVLAERCRQTVLAAGLELFPIEAYANTVTAVQQPASVDFKQLFNYMKDEYGLLMAGAFGDLEGKVIRIGHMGENANASMLSRMFDVFQKGLEAQGVQLDVDMKQYFDSIN